MNETARTTPTNVDPVVRIKRTAEHIDVTYRFPLWESIPAEERLTTEDVQHARGSGKWADFVAQRESGRLAAPKCIVAVRQVSPYKGKWAPCRQDVAEGADLCRRHGGPPVKPPKQPTKAELKAEIERLTALVGDNR